MKKKNVISDSLMKSARIDLPRLRKMGSCLHELDNLISSLEFIKTEATTKKPALGIKLI